MEKIVYSFVENNEDFLTLPDDIREIVNANIVDFENLILGLEMSRWIALAAALNKKGIVEFAKVLEFLKSIQTREDIRYSYIDMKYYKMIVLLQSKEESYEEIYRRFYDFTVAELKYYTYVFKDSAFTGEMEMLPSDAKAAVWLEKMFTSEKDDWESRFHALRMCAKVYPSLGENVKKFAALMGEEQKRQSAEDKQNVQNAANELAQMISLMKNKIREMIEQGLKEEALYTIQQLKVYAKEDEELHQLEMIARNI